jgi:Domain of unknown function (DU1801)
MLSIAFAANVVVSLIFGWMLAQTTGLGYGERVAFVFLAGLAAGIACRVPDWNWHKFPLNHTGRQCREPRPRLVAGRTGARLVRARAAVIDYTAPASNEIEGAGMAQAVRKKQTIAEFLAAQPPDRRKELTRVRSIVRKHLPKGYKEGMAAGMIAYYIPLEKYPDTYNGQPLWYAALASQRNYLTLHLMPVYGSHELERKLRDGFRAEGKRLDMGKACIRFQNADDLALETIGDIVSSVPVDRMIAMARAARRR